ncbi:MAG: phage holin family protein [Geobacteraceae bacterium]|nr:phage holin family protein [Geobacteraceae bacterium]
MKRFLMKWLITTVSLVVVLHVVSGIHTDRRETTVVAALVLGLLNAFLRPLLMLLALPVNLMTLGLFTLVINGFIFYLDSRLVRGFFVAGFWSAFLGALVFSIISCILSFVLKPDGK